MKRKDPVTTEVREAVFARDRGCVAPRLGATDECHGAWTLDHVKDQPRMGVRAPSDPAHLLVLCAHHHLWTRWAPSHRSELRAYLRATSGVHTCDRTDGRHTLDCGMPWPAVDSGA